jgi:hypothetical protein
MHHATWIATRPARPAVRFACAITEIDGRSALACGGYHGRIQVRDLHSGEVLRTFNARPGMIGRLAALAQGRSPILVSAPLSELVQAWDLGSGSGSADPLCTIDLGTQVTALAADPSGDLVAIGTAKGFVVLRFRPRASGGRTTVLGRASTTGIAEPASHNPEAGGGAGETCLRSDDRFWVVPSQFGCPRWSCGSHLACAGGGVDSART